LNTLYNAEDENSTINTEGAFYPEREYLRPIDAGLLTLILLTWRKS
jgi:hypothetical protein